MSRVEDEVRRRMGGMDCPGLVAVSGGPDSVALLIASRRVGVKFTAVHVNHKLRGEESDGDETFVTELAKSLDVPLHTKALPVPEGVNIEAFARNSRYRWFHEVAENLECTWIATAHTADDQAETVLQRIVRGTGLRGLCGMKVWSQQRPHIFLWRPFLESHVFRKELLDYLSQQKQAFRIDSSNSHLRFTRNRIRHEILPLLRTLNPQVDDALLRLSQRALEYEQFLFRQISELQQQAVLPTAGNVTILDANVLSRSDELTRSEFFWNLWRDNDWPLGEMSETHWHRLVTLQSGEYPGGISVRRVDKVVQLWRKP